MVAIKYNVSNEDVLKYLSILGYTAKPNEVPVMYVLGASMNKDSPVLISSEPGNKYTSKLTLGSLKLTLMMEKKKEHLTLEDKDFLQGCKLCSYKLKEDKEDSEVESGKATKVVESIVVPDEVGMYSLVKGTSNDSKYVVVGINRDPGFLVTVRFLKGEHLSIRIVPNPGVKLSPGTLTNLKSLGMVPRDGGHISGHYGPIFYEHAMRMVGAVLLSVPALDSKVVDPKKIIEAKVV